ncbi:hypothetical protein ACLB2K_057416 [Fragaria x ananassa]
MTSLKNPATVAVVFLFLLLIPSFSSAATGGRVGGSLFPSSSSGNKKSKSPSPSPPSSSRSSRHYHAPPTCYSSSSSHSSRHYYAPPTYHSTAAPTSSSWSENAGKAVVGFVILLAVMLCLGIMWDCYTEAEKREGKLSVLKLQVGLMGEARSLQRELNRITETANTSTSEGLSDVLKGATTALLCNLDHCISSYSSVIRKSEIYDAETCFNQFSEEEADKFDDVTLVNLNSFKAHSEIQSPDEIDKEYTVVTILVATDGVLKLPTINGTRDLTKALQKLGAISSSKIMAVEVLWTPQQENDTLTQRELLKGYPDLRGFYEAPSEGQYEDQQPFLGANVA